MEKKNRVETNVIPADVRRNHFYPFLSGYTEEEAKQEASRCLNCKNPQCVKGCPIENRIPDFIYQVKEGNYERAWNILSEKTCMPDICGTVCPHEKQCEGHCIRNRIDEPVAIGTIERFAAEWAWQNHLPVTQAKHANGKTAACVGSGPASMAFAQKLAQEGYAVTIYESKQQAGGVLTWGIPSFRLPDTMIQNHFSQLKELGVQIIYNTEIGKDLTLGDLRNQYDFVFLGIGACVSNLMHIPGENLPGVYDADVFLSRINLSPLDSEGRRSFPECGRRVLVVGGGNVAMDAARDAIRLKQVEKVIIIYRRTEAEMPACSDELTHAKEEGIEFLTLHNPVEFTAENGRVSRAECCINKLGEPDSSGRRRPVDTSLPHLMLDIDTAVLALGFSNDRKFSEGIDGLETDQWGCFKTNEKGETSLENVYAGGDDATGAQTVVKAMKAGMTAAQSVLEKDRK